MTFVQRLVQNLWRHVALGPHFCVGGDVHLVGVAGKQEQSSRAMEPEPFPPRIPALSPPDELDRQPQVGDAAGPVPLHQYVLALQVPVGDGRLALGAEDLGVEVAEARHRGVRQPQHGFVVQRGGFEVVVQGAVLVVVGDQVELGPGARAFDISGYETCGRREGGGQPQTSRTRGDDAQAWGRVGSPAPQSMALLPAAFRIPFFFFFCFRSTDLLD